MGPVRVLVWAVAALVAAVAIPARSADVPASKIDVAKATAVKDDVEATYGTEPERQIKLGEDIFFNDKVLTTANSSAVITFRDHSTLEIGPGATISIDRSVYDPQQGTAEKSITVVAGVFRFVSGLTTEKSFTEIHTPAGTLGIRGSAVSGDVNGNTVAIDVLEALNATFTTPNGVVRPVPAGSTVVAPRGNVGATAVTTTGPRAGLTTRAAAITQSTVSALLASGVSPQVIGQGLAQVLQVEQSIASTTPGLDAVIANAAANVVVTSSSASPTVVASFTAAVIQNAPLQTTTITTASSDALVTATNANPTTLATFTATVLQTVPDEATEVATAASTAVLSSNASATNVASYVVQTMQADPSAAGTVASSFSTAETQSGTSLTTATQIGAAISTDVAALPPSATTQATTTASTSLTTTTTTQTTTAGLGTTVTPQPALSAQ